MQAQWRQLSMVSHLALEGANSCGNYHSGIGEVYVLNDGGEVDLDLGNYERYLNVTLSRDNNITTGKVYQEVISKEACVPCVVSAWPIMLILRHVEARRLSRQDCPGPCQSHCEIT